MQSHACPSLFRLCGILCHSITLLTQQSLWWSSLNRKLQHKQLPWSSSDGHSKHAYTLSQMGTPLKALSPRCSTHAIETKLKISHFADNNLGFHALWLTCRPLDLHTEQRLSTYNKQHWVKQHQPALSTLRPASPTLHVDVQKYHDDTTVVLGMGEA